MKKREIVERRARKDYEERERERESDE